MARRGPSIEQLKRLRDLRMQAGLSLETVAERTGLPVAHVEALRDDACAAAATQTLLEAASWPPR